MGSAGAESGTGRSEIGTVSRTLGVLADVWTLLILQRAFLGVRRYAGWRESLDISDATLASRLRTMTADGLLETNPYREGGRVRREYRLTERGVDTWRLMLVCWSWERTWVPQDPPLPALVHRVCGRPTDVATCCVACGERVGPRDTEVAIHLPIGTGALPRVHPRRTRGPLPDRSPPSMPGVMEIVGDRWGATVLGACLTGIRSFSAFASTLSISPEVLSDRLYRFVDLGVLTRTDRSGYRLTDKGRAAFAIHACLVDWANRWQAADGVPIDVEIRHRECGSALQVRLDCAACREPIEFGAVTLAPTIGNPLPGARPEPGESDS